MLVANHNSTNHLRLTGKLAVKWQALKFQIAKKICMGRVAT